MPGPVIQNPQLPEWADPAQSSVMSPLWKEVARRAVHFMGLDDPQQQIMQVAAGTPLITHFPDQATRQIATEKFRENSSKFPEFVQEAFNKFADRYPRIAAHIVPENHDALAQAGYVDPKMGSNYGYTITAQPVGKFNKYVVGVTQNGIQNTNPYDLINHEGTHVAQVLGNKDFQRLYTAAHNEVGWPNNPYEISAMDTQKRTPSDNDDTARSFRKMIPNVTPDIKNMQQAYDAAANQPAENRLLIKSILDRLTKEAGQVPYTAQRGIQGMVDAYKADPNAYSPNLQTMSDILDSRAAVPSWKPSGQ